MSERFSRWVVLDTPVTQTSVFQCLICGRKSNTPDKTCREMDCSGIEQRLKGMTKAERRQRLKWYEKHMWDKRPTAEERLMSDRIDSLTVVLSDDVRDDDVEMIVNAIAHVRGVLEVVPRVVEPGDHVARMRARAEVREKLIEIVRSL